MKEKTTRFDLLVGIGQQPLFVVVASTECKGSFYWAGMTFPNSCPVCGAGRETQSSRTQPR
jgi:hypothetical protein